MTNDVLTNGSFEEGWKDADNFPGQHPKGWTVEWNVGKAFANPHSNQEYLLGEGVHKSKDMLPAAERDVFVWDGQWTYKLFAASRCLWVRLKQSLSLPAGRYVLETPVWVDCFRWNGGKDYNVEPKQVEMLVKANGVEVAPWLALASGMKHVTSTVIDHPGGLLELAVHYRCNWAISNNLWLDGWSLKAVGVTPPTDPDPEPELSLEQRLWNTAMSVAPVNYDAALQKAILDSERFVPYGPEKWLTENGTQYATQAAMDWTTKQQRAYYCLVPNWSDVRWLDDPESKLVFANWPVTDAPYITQAFGARPEVYQQYGFPGHEGVDIRAKANAPVMAVADGTVTTIDATGNYGKHVRVAHPGGWNTTYAHLNAFSDVEIGSGVLAGQVLGFAGSTGNSTGVHLHLGLSHDSRTYTDPAGNRWPKGIHDPTPYLSPLLTDPRIDLLRYIKGDGRIYQMTVIWQGQQHSQQMQTQTGNGRFYQVKNSEWEEFYADSEYIYRGIDTSPGDGMYYWQRQNSLTDKARWCPRLWTPGDIYERNPLVTFYYKSSGIEATSPPSGYRRTWLRFGAYHPTWKALPNGIEFQDVVELHWLLSATATTSAETYYYARDFGLVGWRSSSGDYSFVVELFDAGERQPMEREKIVTK